jgi:DNA-directed RNA polymerase specialized sigma24 family protein
MHPPDPALIDRLRNPEDLTASKDFLLTTLPWLEPLLSERNRGVDPVHVHDATLDALLGLIAEPTAFDPERGTLAQYLLMAAQGDLRNRLRKEARNTDHREINVELDQLPGKDLGEEEVPRLTDHPAFRRVRAQLPAHEQALLDLLAAGEKATAVRAAALGISDRPRAEQEVLVKKARDRILKRLQRAVAKEGD